MVSEVLAALAFFCFYILYQSLVWPLLTCICQSVSTHCKFTRYGNLLYVVHVEMKSFGSLNPSNRLS